VTGPVTDRPTLPGPGRLGLVRRDARDHLDALGWNTDDHVDLLWSLSRAPDADLALHTMVRLAEAVGDDWPRLHQTLLRDRSLRGRLFSVLGSSAALGDHLVAHPDAWQMLAGDVRLPTFDELRTTFVDAARDTDDPRATSALVPRLRRLYRDQILLLAALDLASVVEDEPWMPVTEVGAQLSDMADAALAAALTVATRAVCGDEPPPRLAVIAMGKCGARELNYVSDVDVIFVADDAEPDQLTVATRIAGQLMRFAADAFFEVDAALRPEGKRGQLVRTLDSHAAYYRRWAKTWEFQALMKARPAAGDPELGQRYIDAVMPMVWTASEREDFVAEVQAMRRRVESLVPADRRERELKLGTGGLRDVEFAVQLLQLVHGRTDESLRVASTVDALTALGAGGYIGRDDAANMRASYEFLRLLEHRLQLQRLKRTHLLPEPDDDEALRWLARAAHIRPDGRHDALGVLREELKRQSRRVSRLHAKLFYQPLLESVGQPVQGITASMPTESAERLLAALGYDGPQNALTHLAALTGQSGRRGRVQRVLLPTLLEWLADTPDPDGGLLAYRRISEALADQRWYLATLRDEGAVAKRLMRVLGTSAYVPDLLMRAPDVIQSYADGPDGPKLLETDPLGRTVSRPGPRDRRGPHPAAPRTGPRRLGRSAGHARRGRGVPGADLGVGGGAAGRAGRGDPRQQPRRAGSRPDRGDRHGPARRRRVGLRLGRRCHVRLRTRGGRGHRPERRRVRCGALGHRDRRAGHRAAGHPQCRPAAGTRHHTATGGTQRSAGAHPGVICGLLQAVGPAVGGAGTAARPRGGR